MKKVALLTLLVAVIYSCGSGGDRGELVGVKSKRRWFSEKPYGMVKVEGSSFTMGKQDEDPLGAMNAPARTVTIQPFYMDETEITNSEYKQFVHWVRDSVLRTRLAEQALVASSGGSSDAEGEEAGGKTFSKGDGEGIQKYAYLVADTVSETPYDKYMREKYYEVEGDSLKPLNWEPELVWDIKDSPDEDYVQVMDSVFSKKDESLNGIRIFKTELLSYRYQWFDNEDAARSRKHRREFLRDKIINIYPDTTVWIRDFNYSYNDPMHQEYFSHKAYENYPVVGVNWHQAKAFCHWRTKYKNIYQRSKNNVALVPSFRLPTEAEWEYAAKGGNKSKRCAFSGSFVPDEVAWYFKNSGDNTHEVGNKKPNELGLFDMSGNVPEWCWDYYQANYYKTSPNSDPRGPAKGEKRVFRGGGWKSKSDKLRLTVRGYMGQNKQYGSIGFRVVKKP